MTLCPLPLGLVVPWRRHSPTERIDPCGRCWEKALRTREENLIEEYTQRFPNVGPTCNVELKGLKSSVMLFKTPHPHEPDVEDNDSRVFERCLDKYIADQWFKQTHKALVS